MIGWSGSQALLETSNPHSVGSRLSDHATDRGLTPSKFGFACRARLNGHGQPPSPNGFTGAIQAIDSCWRRTFWWHLLGRSTGEEDGGGGGDVTSVVDTSSPLQTTMQLLRRSICCEMSEAQHTPPVFWFWGSCLFRKASFTRGIVTQTIPLPPTCRL